MATYHEPHTFEPGTPGSKWNPVTRRYVAGSNPNFCKVCGRKKDHILHPKTAR